MKKHNVIKTPEQPETTRKKQDTRFKPGESGNPKGRPKNSRHHSTVLMEKLLDGQAEKLLQQAIKIAAGNACFTITGNIHGLTKWQGEQMTQAEIMTERISEKRKSMKKPTGKLKRQMEKLVRRLEERRKTSTGARVAEADFLIAITKANLKGEKIDVPLPEILFEH